MSTKKDPRFRHARINARATHTEFRLIYKKALLYANGNISEYLRIAALGYTPKKGEK
jgi:hypothetical protein